MANKTAGKTGREGYTLIEMLCVIAIVTILATMGLPRFALALQKTKTATVQENLAQMRTALNIYASDAGAYPQSLSALTNDYMPVVPVAQVPLHADSNAIAIESTPSDAGGWSYNNTPGDPRYGMLVINCTHTDVNGQSWSSY